MSWKRFSAISLVLIICFFAVMSISARGIPIVLQTNLETLPLQIGEYAGQEASFPDSVYEVLNADLHVYRHYRAPNKRPIDLYIGYYGTAKGGRTGHNPYACLPGAGWGIVEQGRVVSTPPYYPEGVHLNYTISRKGEVHNVMLHWYQSAGTKVLVSGIQQNLQRLKGRVINNRNDGAYIQVSSLVADDDLTIVKENLNEFASIILELLPSYWPVEKIES